jgi:hypothetical protein
MLPWLQKLVQRARFYVLRFSFYVLHKKNQVATLPLPVAVSRDRT